MKTSLLFLIVLTSVNICCISQKSRKGENNLSNYQKTNKINKIELKEQTRGTNRLFTFNPNYMDISLNGNITKVELSSVEWKNITDQANLLNFSKISNYQSPITGRLSDRALSSSIVIFSGGKIYESSTFDAGIPPKELEGLYLLLKNKAGITKKGEPKLR